jgi:response regulator NasT
LVGDDPLAVFSLSVQLSILGHLVVAEATDGQEAVSLARQLCPDVVVMDIEMLGMDGLEASKHIDRDGLCPIVLLGGRSKTDWVQEAISIPAVYAYLTKPVNERDLEPAIELALAHFRQIEQLEQEKMLLTDILDTCPTLTRATEYRVTNRTRSLQETQEWIQQESRIKTASLDKVA